MAGRAGRRGRGREVETAVCFSACGGLYLPRRAPPRPRRWLLRETSAGERAEHLHTRTATRLRQPLGRSERARLLLPSSKPPSSSTAAADDFATPYTSRAPSATTLLLLLLSRHT